VLVLEAGRRMQLTGWQWAILACSGIGITQVWLGQLGGLMAWLLVRAWENDRNSSSPKLEYQYSVHRNTYVPAALWLGLAIAIKPFLALVAVGWLMQREWKAALTTAGTVLVVLLVGLLVCGVTPYRDWLTLSQHISWHGDVANVSLQRVPGWPLIAAALFALTAWRIRQGAEIWTLLPLALLCSPVTWQYYGWLLLPILPMLGWGWLGIALLGLPQYLVPYTGVLGLLLVACAALRPATRERQAAAGTSIRC
jgi:hypothetical protein